MLIYYNFQRAPHITIMYSALETETSSPQKNGTHSTKSALLELDDSSASSACQADPYFLHELNKTSWEN